MVGCLTACPTFLSSPSLTGWEAIFWGCTSACVSFRATHAGACYRAEYGCTGNKKAVYNCIRVAPPRNPQRPERMCKRLSTCCVQRQQFDSIKEPKRLRPWGESIDLPKSSVLKPHAFWRWVSTSFHIVFTPACPRRFLIPEMGAS